MALLSQFAGEVGGLFALGFLADYFLETRPWGVLVAGVIGVPGALYLLLRRVLKP